MGWKGTLRTMNSISRSMEREARRRRRELEKQQKQVEKMQELQRAAYEVQVYNNYIDMLQSMHKECTEACNWEEIRLIDPPTEPIQLHTNEKIAQAALENYKPGFRDKLLNKSDDRRLKLTESLKEAINADEREYQKLVEQHAIDRADWEETIKIAENIIQGDLSAYLDAINTANPFEEIEEIGASVDFYVESSFMINATLQVNGNHVVPSEAKNLLKNGRLSVKSIPKGRFYEIYQDYVCSCVLRVSREFFAILPVETLVITAMTKMLNTQTGHMEEMAIFSAVIPRKTVEMLNFDTLDPSDSMSNFVHRMDFKKTKGFAPIEPITPDTLDLGH